jgi:hypothetical protein
MFGWFKRSLQTLPLVDGLEIVVLTGVAPNNVESYMDAAAHAPMFLVAGPEAESIAALVRALTPGEEGRCHSPPYGLRFRAGRWTVCEISICWACNNIFGRLRGRPFHMAFDASHESAQALLTRLQEMIAGRSLRPPDTTADDAQERSHDH